MKRLLLLLFFSSSIANSFAMTDSLFIVRDSIQVIDLTVIQTVFSHVDSIQPRNKHLIASVGENINLVIKNSDDLDHTFTIDGIIDEEIPAQMTVSFSFSILSQGTYRYYSKPAYGSLIGASGILQIGYENEISYFWNLNDASIDLSYDLSEQIIDHIPVSYKPNLFFINGFSFPETLEDETGYINQQVGDEIIISIVNSGNMDHVLHFHGYHIEILDVTHNTRQLGWIKDTFPLIKAEAMTVKLIPHQPGVYPVHDHNLIAVTTSGLYPGGMITQLNISE